MTFKETALAKLRDNVSGPNCFGTFGFIDGYDKAMGDSISIIESIQEEPRWIPVTERLPEADKRILIEWNDGYVEIGSLRMKRKKKFFITEDQNDQNFYELSNVKRWMPLHTLYE